MRTIVLFLVIILVSLQYKLWMGEGSVSHWLHLEQKRRSQEHENKKMAAHNQALMADIAELKSSDHALEEQARFELGMIKEGEVYYHVVDQ